MRLGHLFGQILPIVQNASAASTVTGGFCLFSQVSLPGSEKSDPGIPESSREFPLPGIPIVAPCSTIHRTAGSTSMDEPRLRAPQRRRASRAPGRTATRERDPSPGTRHRT